MGYNRTANAFYYLLTLYTYSAYVKLSHCKYTIISFTDKGCQ